MFSVHAAQQALSSLQQVNAVTALAEAKRYTAILAPWFAGLAVCVQPVEMRCLTPDGQAFAGATGAWSWVYAAHPPGEPAYAFLEVRLFINQQNSTSMQLAYTVDQATSCPGWNPTEWWADVQDYADATLDEPGTFRSYTGHRIYSAPMPNG